MVFVTPPRNSMEPLRDEEGPRTSRVGSDAGGTVYSGSDEPDDEEDAPFRSLPFSSYVGHSADVLDLAWSKVHTLSTCPFWVGQKPTHFLHHNQNFNVIIEKRDCDVKNLIMAKKPRALFAPIKQSMWSLSRHLIDQRASHCMGKMSESDFAFDRVRKFGI